MEYLRIRVQNNNCEYIIFRSRDLHLMSYYFKNLIKTLSTLLKQ